MKKLLAYVMVAIASVLSFCASAQEAETADLMQVAAEGSKEVSTQGVSQADSLGIRISIVTCYPGSRNYELYGHTMIRVQVNGEDLLFNYGIFNFRAKGFLYRFVKGECDYVLAAYPYYYLTQGYESRKIVEQELNLTDEQKRKVVAFLWENAMPENATYRYDWAYNNCATKPRDIVEMAVGESLRYGEPEQPGASFREIMAYYDRNYPWQQFGIDLVLGSGLDKKLTYREQMFSPIKLMQALAGATVERDGERVPLVSHTCDLVEGGDEGAALGPTPFVLTPLFVFLALFAVALAFTVMERRKGVLYRWLDSAVFGAFALAGVLVAFLTLVSTHYGTSPNVNALWVHPLAFIPAICVWIKKSKRVLAVYHIANAAVIVLLAAAWGFLPQVGNVAFIPMAALSLVRSVNYLLYYKKNR